jgi:hypothetical protein
MRGADISFSDRDREMKDVGDRDRDRDDRDRDDTRDRRENGANGDDRKRMFFLALRNKAGDI